MVNVMPVFQEEELIFSEEQMLLQKEIANFHHLKQHRHLGTEATPQWAPAGLQQAALSLHRGLGDKAEMLTH